MGAIAITEHPATDLAEYSRIPIAFTVESILEVSVIDRGLGGILMSERKVAVPYVKDYDSVSDEGPTRWAKRWEISNWGAFTAHIDNALAGGCVIAFDTPGVHKLEGRKDIAVLWDLRVHPERRRSGIGTMLFNAAVAWAEQRNCCLLKVETQNINVPACTFYAKQGCELRYIDRSAYTEFLDEVELNWYKELSPGSQAPRCTCWDG